MGMIRSPAGFKFRNFDITSTTPLIIQPLRRLSFTLTMIACLCSFVVLVGVIRGQPQVKNDVETLSRSKKATLDGIFNLTQNSQEDDSEEGGRPALQIYNGRDARPFNAANAAIIYVDEDGTCRLLPSRCTGTIVDSKTVYTAAHCFKDCFESRQVVVGVGSRNLNPPGPHYATYQVDMIIPHFDYQDLNTTNIPHPHDIALLVLREEIKLDPPYVQILLPVTEKDVINGGHFTAYGYGKKSKQAEYLADILQEAGLELVSPEACYEAYQKQYRNFPRNIDPNTMVCARSPQTATERSLPCEGDSGGPLVWTDKFGKLHRLFGIMSYGACGRNRTHLPWIFISVKSYRKWFQCIDLVLAGNYTKMERNEILKKIEECTRCPKEKHFCLQSGKCIEPSLVCNGVDDCDDRSDEDNCHGLPVMEQDRYSPTFNAANIAAIVVSCLVCILIIVGCLFNVSNVRTTAGKLVRECRYKFWKTDKIDSRPVVDNAIP